ncbi:HAD-IIIA family hydrolase [Patescibacteria group bacterium]|nr:HAD-IIIA family hydrolase [Patescibacteria group bacterium]MBU4023497.1 HAD-IIIA family hydrolase [Patescibacteria group bacterium]
MKISEYITKYLSETEEIVKSIDKEAIEKVVNVLLWVKSQKGRLFFLGVGGGAGTGSHAANDFNKYAKISSFCLSDNASLITALTNDENFDAIFKRQLEMHSLTPNDCLFIFSVGGGTETTSKNLVAAIEYAKEIGAKIVGVVGKDTGATAQKGDGCIIVPCPEESRRTAHTESFQLMMDHLIVFLLDEIGNEMKNKAIFWDRDGIINKVVTRNGETSSPWKLEEFEILSDVKECLEMSKEMGFLNIVFTNQPDISRGNLRIEDLEKMHKIIAEKLPMDEIKFCPHDNQDNCSCRKPKPGLISEAVEKWSIDLGKSYVIGDSWKDIEAGKSAGCKTFLLRREYNKDFQKDYDFEINNLKQAVKIIKKLDKK